MAASGRASSVATSEVRGAEAGRRHAALPHTADVGFAASAGDLAALFEEAAVALAELSSETAHGAAPTSRMHVTLQADDLSGLAFAWLNELIALGEIHRAALVSVVVDRLDDPWAIPGVPRPTIDARIGLRSFQLPDVRSLRTVKSATFHRLVVERHGHHWTMHAYLDV